MPSVNTIVWKIISDDLSIQNNLQRGLINTRGLARYLIQEKGIKASIDAVISAIRRYEDDSPFVKMVRDAEKVLKSIIITTKSNVCCLTMNDSEFDVISKDFNSNKTLKENFRLTKSKESIKLFLNQKDLEMKVDLFDQDKVYSVVKDLAEIRITLPEDAIKNVGLLAKISQEIALNGVSIHEVIVSVPEILIYVKHKDLVKAHQAVMGITSD